MAKKLWFITDGIEPIEVYDRREEAERQLTDLEREEEEVYELYFIEVDELEDYPREMELAEEYGLI